MVAKSFQNLKINGEPFYQNGRAYVNVITANGGLRKVRWYSENEYNRMYPEAKNDHSNDPYYKTQKVTLGFVNDFITIFKNNTYENSDYFRSKGARYTKWWGWSFASDVEIPEDLPEGVSAVRLDWNAVGNNDGKLKSDKEVADVIDSLLYEDSDSEYQGVIGEKIERILIVEKAVALDGVYGPSTLYSMKDNNENIYVWITTSTKTHLEEGHSYFVKGTVKDHKKYKAQKQTILTRCAIIK